MFWHECLSRVWKCLTHQIFSNCCRNRVADELYEYCVVSFKRCGFIPQTPDHILFPIYWQRIDLIWDLLWRTTFSVMVWTMVDSYSKWDGESGVWWERGGGMDMTYRSSSLRLTDFCCYTKTSSSASDLLPFTALKEQGALICYTSWVQLNFKYRSTGI